MSQKSLPILVLALLILGGLYYWQDLRDEGPEDDRRATSILAGLEGPPDHLTLQSHVSEGKFYRLSRSGELWLITDPVEDEASDARMKSILDPLLAATKTLAFRPEEITKQILEETELLRPGATIVVGSGDSRVKIEFGGEDVRPNTSFVRIDGSIYRVPTGLGHGAEINLLDLRNRLLIRNRASGITRLVLERSESEQNVRLVLDRDASGRFHIVEPFACPADRAKVAQLLAAFFQMRIKSFRPMARAGPDEQRPRPKNKWLDIRVEGTEGVDQIEIFRPAPGLALALKKGRRSLLEVDPRGFAQVVERPAADLISTVLWTLGPSQAKQIKVRVQGGKDSTSYALERTAPEPGYRLVAPLGFFANDSAVTELIAAIEKCRVLRLARGAEEDVARRALEVPRLILALEPPSSARVDALTVRLGLAPDGQLYARRNDENLVFAVAGESLPVLLRPWWKLAKRLAFRVGEQQPVEIVEVEGGNEKRSFELSGGGWRLAGKDCPDFEDAFDAFKKLVSREVVGDDGDRRFEDRTPELSIRCFASRAGKRVPQGSMRLFHEDGDWLVDWSKSPGLVHRIDETKARRILNALTVRCR